MKVKNLKNRNISVSANHNKIGGEPFRVVLPAGATLEITNKEYKLVKKPILKLVGEGILKIEEQPESALTIEEIIALVKKEANVLLSDKETKEVLQVKAEVLGVSLN